MKVGDLVGVYYESRRYYIILEAVSPGPEAKGGKPYVGEQLYRLLGLTDGIERIVRRSEIKIINEA